MVESNLLDRKPPRAVPQNHIVAAPLSNPSMSLWRTAAMLSDTGKGLVLRLRVRCLLAASLGALKLRRLLGAARAESDDSSSSAIRLSAGLAQPWAGELHEQRVRLRAPTRNSTLDPEPQAMCSWPRTGPLVSGRTVRLFRRCYSFLAMVSYMQFFA